MINRIHQIEDYSHFQTMRRRSWTKNYTPNNKLERDVRKFINTGTQNRAVGQGLLNALYKTNVTNTNATLSNLRKRLKNIDRTKLEQYASRTIKRIVIKKHAQKHYDKYTGIHSTAIKRGNDPMAAVSLFRRMKSHPVTVNVPIYRGLSNPNLYKKFMNNGRLDNSFASFSKNKNTAQKFSSGYGKGIVLALPPGRYPAINSSVFGRGEWGESEVTLAPGTYTVNTSKQQTVNAEKNGSLIFKAPVIPVKYNPSNRPMYFRNGRVSNK